MQECLDEAVAQMRAEMGRRMAEEAEAHAEEDKKFRENTEAKQALEHYLYTMAQALEDESIKNKLADDYDDLANVVTEAKKWYDENDKDGGADDFKAKKSEVERALKPLQSLAGGKGDDADEADFDDADDEEL